jgi:hypothetical protein
MRCSSGVSSSGVIVRCSIAPIWPADLAQRECQQDLRADLGLQLRPLALGAQVRAFQRVDPLGLRRGRDRLRRGRLAGPQALVGALAGDELLLAAGELDAVGELVLGDRALALDRERAALEGRLVGALLDRLARRLAQRLLDVGARRDRRHPDGDHLEPELLERRLGGQPGGDPRPDRRHAVGEDAPQLELDEVVDDELLGQLRQQPSDLLERRLRPAAAEEVDREVHAAGEALRVADPEVDRALDGQLLEVRAAGVEEERQLAVVDRHLGDGRVDRPEPEGQAGALAPQRTAAVVEHVAGRLGAQVADEWEGSDVSHVTAPR